MKTRQLLKILLILLFVYVAGAYFLAPDYWKHYNHHPELEGFAKTSFTKEGLPGDPLNVGFIGSADELGTAMSLAGWKKADPLKISSDLAIAKTVALNQTYPNAPVSNLYLGGRPQDFAFEKQAGASPRSRHHARFWKTEITGENGKPLWLGSATFDRSVGLSHTTGQITHHIAPDIDSERDGLMEDLTRAGQLERIYQVSGVDPILNGKNGSGDSYYTDGEMTIGVIPSENHRAPIPPMDPNPVKIEVKNWSWDVLKRVLQS